MKISKQNKNSKEVSIVYGKDNSINVNIFNNKILMEIAGSFDNNFKELEKDFPNFKFYIALSEPTDEDNWKVKKSLDGDGDGFIGFIHQVVIDQYLSKHDSPEDIEVYYCGPPLMNLAVAKMAEDFGVPPENVRFDDFGG